MIEHIVLFKLKKGVSQRQLDECEQGVRSLKKFIPGLISVTAGYNNSPENINKDYNWGFIVAFKDKSSRDMYVPHPEHQKVIARFVEPIIEDVLVFDYEHN